MEVIKKYTETEIKLCAELRVLIGEGLMTCKKLLQDTDWNVEKAVKLYYSEEWLEYRMNKDRI